MSRTWPALGSMGAPASQIVSNGRDIQGWNVRSVRQLAGVCSVGAVWVMIDRRDPIFQCCVPLRHEHKHTITSAVMLKVPLFNRFFMRLVQKRVGFLPEQRKFYLLIRRVSICYQNLLQAGLETAPFDYQAAMLRPILPRSFVGTATIFSLPTYQHP